MPQPELSDFRLRFPEFADTSDSQIEIALRDAYGLHRLSSTATLYCAAHLLVLRAEETSDIDRGSGVVTQQTIGSVSLSFLSQVDDKNKWEAFFAATSYGRQFLIFEKRSRFAVSARMVG